MTQQPSVRRGPSVLCTAAASVPHGGASSFEAPATGCSVHPSETDRTRETGLRWPQRCLAHPAHAERPCERSPARAPALQGQSSWRLQDSAGPAQNSGRSPCGSSKG